MTDLNTASPHSPHSKQPSVVALLKSSTSPSTSRLLGIIMSAVALCDTKAAPATSTEDQPTNSALCTPDPFPSAQFNCAMDQLRVYLESKVREAGYHGPLDFTWQDFADRFNDVAPKQRQAVLEALTVWYRTIYVRHLHQEQPWRDLYEDTSTLTKEEELALFEGLRNGVGECSQRCRDLLIRRNHRLIAHFAKRYVDTLAPLINLGEERYWEDDHGQQYDGGESLLHKQREAARAYLFKVGREGLEKAIDRFKPELGYRLSTPAGHWIPGEMTGLFKKIEGIQRKLMKGVVWRPAYVPRVEEDYLELCCAVGQALDRLSDPRKAQIVIMRYGLFGAKERSTFKEIGEACGVSQQYVHKLLPTILEELKQDEELRAFHMSWFGRSTSSWWSTFAESKLGVCEGATPRNDQQLL